MLFYTPTKYGSDRFRQIFIDHWERWWDRRREEIPADQRAYVRQTIDRMMLCRNPHGGFARYVCPGCEDERIVPFSCKTRFCPSCGKVKTDAWVDRVAGDLLEVPHLHLTLTIAQQLRGYFEQERDLLRVLLTIALEAVREVIAREYPGLQVGFIYTIHTTGRDLIFKPHVHLVMTKGGLRDGQWVVIDNVPGGLLAVTWRRLLCRKLRQRRPFDGRLRAIISDLYRKFDGFYVYTDSFYPKGIDAASYMGRYLGHPPLATSRLVGYDGRQVHFWYRETATGLRRDVILPAADFITLMVKHIPLKGMQVVRHAGLYARSIKAKLADIAQKAIDALSPQIRLFDLAPFVKQFRRLSLRERFKASFGLDPLECRSCRLIMQLAEIREPKRGFIWMRRWLETHRRRKAAREALARALARRPKQYRQLALGFL